MRNEKYSIKAKVKEVFVNKDDREEYAKLKIKGIKELVWAFFPDDQNIKKDTKIKIFLEAFAKIKHECDNEKFFGTKDEKLTISGKIIGKIKREFIIDTIIPVTVGYLEDLELNSFVKFTEISLFAYIIPDYKQITQVDKSKLNVEPKKEAVEIIKLYKTYNQFSEYLVKVKDNVFRVRNDNNNIKPGKYKLQLYGKHGSFIKCSPGELVQIKNDFWLESIVGVIVYKKKRNIFDKLKGSKFTITIDCGFKINLEVTKEYFSKIRVGDSFIIRCPIVSFNIKNEMIKNEK